MVNLEILKTVLESEFERVCYIADIVLKPRDYYEDIMTIGKAQKINNNGISIEDLLSDDKEKVATAMVSIMLGRECDFKKQDDHQLLEDEGRENELGSYGFWVPLVRRQMIHFRGFRVQHAIYAEGSLPVFNSRKKFMKLIPVKNNLKKIFEENLYKEQIDLQWHSCFSSCNGKIDNFIEAPNFNEIVTTIFIMRNKQGIFEILMDNDFEKFMKKHQIYNGNVFEEYFEKEFGSFSEILSKRDAYKFYEVFSNFVKKYQNTSDAKAICEAICTLIHTY